MPGVILSGVHPVTAYAGFKLVSQPDKFIKFSLRLLQPFGFCLDSLLVLSLLFAARCACFTLTIAIAQDAEHTRCSGCTGTKSLRHDLQDLTFIVWVCQLYALARKMLVNTLCVFAELLGCHQSGYAKIQRYHHGF
jgi:hypothetical protein